MLNDKIKKIIKKEKEIAIKRMRVEFDRN